MKRNDEIYENALKVAHLYYYHGLTTEAIAKEINFSRPKVSRLLSFAREEGLVEIKIIDKNSLIRPVEKGLIERFKALHELSVVSVPETLNKQECLERVAQFTANYLNTVFEPNQLCGLSWSPAIIEVCKHLTQKKIPRLRFVQLHGNYTSNQSGFIARIMYDFTKNYQAKATILPAPAFFDYPETKSALWQEHCIQQVLDIQKKADILLFSICDFESDIKNHQLYLDGFINDKDIESLKEQNVIGEISAIFFRQNGSYADISLNARSSGCSLDLFKNVAHSICIISSSSAIPALTAALDSGYISELIIDEITARNLLEYAQK
jgi:deoxyribonucleoside regulator